MADSAPIKKTLTINALPEFTSDVYANIAPAELVVFAVFTLKNDGAYTATEEIVSACFRLFPQHFSLKNYFYWPDSASIVSFLNEAKNKGDLKGNPAEGFAVKVQGRQTVKRVAKVLGVTLPALEKKVQTPAPVPETKQVEPVQPAQPEAEKKEEVPQETTPVQPVLNETPVEKTIPAPQKKKPIRKPLVKKQPVKVEKKPVTPLTKKATAKKQAVVSKKKKPVVPAVKEKSEKKKAAAPKEKKAVKKQAVVEKKKPVKKQIVPSKEKKAIAPAAKDKPAKKKAVAPVVKETPVKKQAPKPAKKIIAKVTAPKQTTPVKAKALPQVEPVKQELLLQVKVEEPKKKEQAKPVAPAVVKKTAAPKAEKPKKQVPVKKAEPAQLTMLPLVEEKKEKSAPPVEKKIEPKPVKVQMVIAPTATLQVSKEEKVRAGKVVQVMERSDAYRQYKKNGDKSKISEFDFRSLLLCTMESTPETLARNVNTFKGYASIQNRQDLAVFLNFVESSFSGLLNSSGKKLAKKK